MLEINRTLLQLDKAVECANSVYPQEKALAIILLDNLIELQLYRRAEREFLWDQTRWFQNRKHKSTKRKNISGKHSHYSDLLKFSYENKLITQNEKEALNVAHEIRNEVYHRGLIDNNKIDLTLLIYFGFLYEKLIKWGSVGGIGILSSSGITPSGYEFITFDHRSKKSKKYSIINWKEYYSNSINIILNKLKLKNDLYQVATQIVAKQISDIQSSLQFISNNIYIVSGALGHYWYLNNEFSGNPTKRKFNTLDKVLLTYAFLREYQNQLDDIDDTQKRQKEGKKLFKEYKKTHKGIYPHWVNLEKIQQQTSQLKKKDNSILFKTIFDIETRISKLQIDARTAANDVDHFISQLIDYSRGK